jgi:succinoglycan biosynthesis protein ExoM
MRENHVNVCVCTYKRPQLLRRALEGILGQRVSGEFTFSVIVSDNDSVMSAKAMVAELSVVSAIEIEYCCEPEKNIALARNRAVLQADGEYVAFIDDDEFPAADWLQQSYRSIRKYKASGVLGPVRPHFDEPPPSWILDGGFCERPEHPTGRVMPWSESRSGNLLFRRSILEGEARPFDPQFGTGGEDMDFFRRMTEQGCVFVWCNEAVAYEVVPPSRWSNTYLLKRAMLRGKNILKHPAGYRPFIGTSLAAVPIYLLLLPLTAIGGRHYFMKYCIKLCDHAGRLLGLIGMNPVHSRDT